MKNIVHLKRATKEPERLTDKLLRLARQRKLAKLIQFNKRFVNKFCQCSDLEMRPTKTTETVSSLKEKCKTFETPQKRQCQKLKKEDTHFVSKGEKTPSDEMSTSPQTEELVNSMQKELDIIYLYHIPLLLML